jgi:Holliday junction resolvasome RuvABC DNA-binding subunit
MGNPKTNARKRTEFRRYLESLGYSPAEVERAVASREERRAAKARQADQEEALDQAHKPKPPAQEWEYLDDTGYRPTQVDSVLTGVARATGQTAAAVKRRSTMTSAQYYRWKGNNG